MGSRSAQFLLALTACATVDIDDPTDEAAPDTDAPDTDGVDTDAPDTDVDTDDTAPPADTDTDTDTDVGGDTGTAQVVRFVALGDAGEGNPDQYAVGEALGTVCAQRGCDFALYLGDNFYDRGVDGVDDAQFQSKFELPYADLDFPFYIVLGNHDFGDIPVEFWRTDFQVDYTQHSTKWTMPSHYHDWQAGPAHFMALDTNSIMLGLPNSGPQTQWVRNILNNTTSTWTVAFGHHPWKSNGQHGNAGNYEGAWYDVTGLVRGAAVQEFFANRFCRKLDLYISGHDHNRQWLDPVCGVHVMVSGAGSKTTDFVHRDGNGTVWEDDTTEGFVWIELRGRQATIAWYDKDGNLDHEGIITK